MFAPLISRISAPVKTTLRAFRSRNYRLFFSGYFISLIGMWLQQVAMGWLVYRLTGSAMLLGVVGFAGQIPVLVIAPLSGVLSDRWNKRHMVMVTQALAMAQAFILAALVLSGHVQVWHLVVLSVFLGIANGFEMTARQSFVIEMVERREDLGNAIALNSVMFNGARFIGPSIGGFMIASLGEGMCFLINGLSFVAAISALMLMRFTPKPASRPPEKLLDGFLGGVRYTFGFPPIRSIVLFLAVMSLMAHQYAVVMPVYAKDVLHQGPRELGILVAAIGAGALSGALFLASRKSVVGLGRFIAAATLVFGVSLIAFAFSRSLALSAVLLYIGGIGFMVQLASCNTIVQTIVDDDKRGRVMSFYSLSLMGMAPFGSLLAGWLAGRVNPQAPFLWGGICAVIGAWVFWRLLPNIGKQIDPIFRARGLLGKNKVEIEGARAVE